MTSRTPRPLTAAQVPTLASQPSRSRSERHGALDESGVFDAMRACAERERLREAGRDGELVPERATGQWPEANAFKASAERANDAATGVACESPERRQSDAAVMTAESRSRGVLSPPTLLSEDGDPKNELQPGGGQEHGAAQS